MRAIEDVQETEVTLMQQAGHDVLVHATGAIDIVRPDDTGGDRDEGERR